MVGVVLAGPVDLENQVSPTERFALVKNFTKIVAQSQETYRLLLDQLYRGQLLQYSWNLTFLNGTEVPLKLINITKPYHLMKQSVPVKENSPDEYALPQTSMLYSDKYKNRFLIVIDAGMRLRIHNITEYYKDDPVNLEKDSIVIDLSTQTNSSILSPDKSCNNFMQVNETLLVANCKSNQKMSMSSSLMSVLIFINLDKLPQKRAPTLTYFFSDLLYDELLDGTLLMFKQVSKDPLNFRFFMKENATHCCFKLIEFNSENKGIHTNKLLTINQFEDPYYNSTFLYDREIQNDQKPKRMLRSSHIINVRKAQIKEGAKAVLNQFPPGPQPRSDCNPLVEPQQFDTPKISYLTVRDIKTLPFKGYENVIAASDYLHGLLFWNLNETMCDDPTKIDGKVVCYDAKPLYRVRFENFASLSVLPEDNLDGERIIFATVVSPPRVIEITVDNVERPPYVSRIYSLSSQINEFHSLDVMDGNSQYILTYLVNIKSMVPSVRIYRRKYQGEHSNVYADLPLPSDFVDSGLFLKFITVNQNFFLLRTSNIYQIYSIEPTYLEMNLWDIDSKKILGLDYNPTEEVSLHLTLKVKNQTMHTLITKFDVLVMDSTTLRTQILLPSGTNIPIKFACGETLIISGQQMSRYFSGQYPLIQIDQDRNKSFFLLEKTNVAYKVTNTFKGKNCFMNALVKFKKTNLNYRESWYIACMPDFDKRFSFINVYQGNNDTAKEFQIADYDLTMLKTASIFSLYFESNQNQLYILTKDQGILRLHIFTLYNIMTWQSTVHLKKDIAELADFDIRDIEPMTFTKTSRMGALISKPRPMQQNILIFEITEQDIFRIRANIKVDFSVEGVEIQDVQIDHQGFIWCLLSDGLLKIYQQIGPDVERNNQTLIDRYLNFQLIRLFKEIDLNEQIRGGDKKPKIHAFNVNHQNEMIIVFSGDKRVTLHKYQSNSFAILESMQLPVYFDNQYEDESRGFQLQFVINNVTQRPVYHDISNFLFIVFELKDSGQTTGRFQLQIFNIKEPLHNALGVKFNLTTSAGKEEDIDLDTKYAAMQAFMLRDLPEELYGVQITLDEHNRVTYEFNPNTQLVIDPNKRQEFNEACKLRKNFNFSLYPLDNQLAKINFQVIPRNRGQLITKKNDFDEMTVEVLSQNMGTWYPQQKTAKYNLLSNVNGFNMKFNFSCPTNNESNTNQICNDLSVQQQFSIHEVQIDFLSSKNRAVGFFVIENFLLFFDQENAHIYSLDLKQYMTEPLGKIFRFLENTEKQPFNTYPKIEDYRFFTLDFEEGISESYLITFNNFNQMSVSRVLVNTTELSREDFINSTKNYFPFQNLQNPKQYLQIQYADIFSSLFSKMYLSEFFTLNPETRGEFSGILVFDDPKNIYQSSRVEMHNFQVREDPSSVIMSRNFSFKSLYSDRQSINLKVTCAQVMVKSRVLILGIKSVGLLFYSLDDQKILKLEQLTKKFVFGSTNPSILDIIGIYPQTERNFHLLTLRRGLISISYPELSEVERNRYGKYEKDPSLYEEAGQKEQSLEITEMFDPRKIRRMMTKSNEGIVFARLKSDLDFDQGNDQLQLDLYFYDFSAANKSKQVGSYQLARADQNCSELHKVNNPEFLRAQFPSNSSDEHTRYFAMVCLQSIKFIAFNFHPAINISMQKSYKQEVSVQQFSILASNSLSNQTFQLNLKYLNQDHQLGILVYAVFIIIIAFTLLTLQKLAGKQYIQKKQYYKPTAAPQNQAPLPQLFYQSKSTAESMVTAHFNKLSQSQTFQEDSDDSRAQSVDSDKKLMSEQKKFAIN